LKPRAAGGGAVAGAVACGARRAALADTAFHASSVAALGKPQFRSTGLAHVDCGCGPHALAGGEPCDD